EQETGIGYQSLSGLMLIGLIRSNPEPVALTRESLPRAAGQTLECVRNGLYLLYCRGTPFCAVLQGRSHGARKQAVLQILAKDRPSAQEALDEVLQLAARQSVYKGNVISLERFEHRDEDFSVQFHDLPPVDREAIVLPEKVLEVVERNVL